MRIRRVGVWSKGTMKNARPLALLKTTAFWVALLLCPMRAQAASWFQDDFSAGAVNNSTTNAQIGWTAYESSGTYGIETSSGLQILTNIPRSWTQNDDGTSDSGFNRSGAVFSTATVNGSGSAAQLSMVFGESVTVRGQLLLSPASFLSAAWHPGQARFYLFGGRDNSNGFTNNIFAYDPVANTLIDTGHNLTGARSGTSAVYEPGTGNIFIFGGFDVVGIGSAEVLEYDPGTGLVTTQAGVLPSGRSRTSAAYDPVSAKIYVFGGSQTFTNNLLDEIVRYDPVGDNIVLMSTRLPTARVDTSAAYDSGAGLIHIFGGEDSGGLVDDVIAFDATQDSRTIRTAVLPSSRAAMGAAYDTGTNKTYLFGGKVSGGHTSQILEYEGLTDTLITRGAVLESSRAFSAAAFRPDDGSTYIFGGSTGTPSGFDDVYAYLRFATGTYTSSVFDTGTQSRFSTVDWNPLNVFSSSVTLTIGVRAGNTPTPNATWTNGGEFQSFSNGGSLAALGIRRYVQYTSTFATANLSTSAVINSITLSYFQTNTSATLTSSAFDSGEVLNILQDLQWAGDFPTGTTAHFQIRTSSDNGAGQPLGFGPFLGPTSANDYYTFNAGSNAINALHVDTINDQWFQYRTILYSTDTVATPTLSTVTISYAARPAVPSMNLLVALSSADLQLTFTDNSTTEDEFVLSTGATNCTISTGTAVATLNKPGTGGTQNIPIGGFTPNSIVTTCVRAHINPPFDLFSLYSSSLNVFTLANIPGPPAATVVSTGFVQLAWNANLNPGFTVYEISMSSDNFTATVSTPVPFSNGLIATTTNVFGLDRGTTWYFRVRAQNGNALRTGFSVTAATETLPTPVSGVAASALGISSVVWTWNSAGPAADYRIFQSTAIELIGISSSTQFILTGMPTNTSNSILIQPYNSAGNEILTQATTGFTLADDPTALTVISNSTDALSVIWSSGTSPPGTAFEVSFSSDGFTTFFSTPVPFAALTQPATTLFNLAPGSSVSVRVAARNGAGIVTPFTNVITTQTFPAAIPAPVGTALGVSSISWTWSAVGGPTVGFYNLYRASDASLLTQTTTPFFVETVLSTNTAYGLFLTAVNNSGESPLSPQTTAFTAPAAPVNTQVAQLFKSSVIISWGINGNPIGTQYETQRSTDNVQFSVVALVSTDTFADVNLPGLTTYYWRVRTFSVGGLFSPFDVTVSTFVVGDPPLPPSAFTAVPVGSNFIKLNWQISPSTTVAQYNIHYDNATGTIDYNSTFQAALGRDTTALIVGPLTANTTYRFGLRAEDQIGVDDGNSFVVAEAAALPILSRVAAIVRSPPPGLRVSGDHITVEAEITAGSLFDVKRITFQFRALGAPAWTDIVAQQAEHPNSDSEPPFLTHWDASLLAPGFYELRAIATDKTTTIADPFTPITTILIDHATPEFEERQTAPGRFLKRLKVFDSKASELTMTDGPSQRRFAVALDSGAVANTDTYLRVELNPAAAPPAGAHLADPAIYLDVSLESGQTLIAGGKTARLTMTHIDTDNNNRVDGTAVRADNLRFFYRNIAQAEWQADFPSQTSSADGFTVSALTPHFTLFALFSPQNSNLSNVRVYPIPFKPNDGNPDSGKRYSAGDPTSGIIFDSLTGDAKIRIYTVAGSLVWESPNTIIGGLYQWDGRNGDGREVVSGVYFAVITGTASEPVVRKIVVLR
jgi:hypothetical protein